MAKKSVQEKVQGEFPDFATEVAGMTPEELDRRLLSMAKDLEESELAREADEELTEAKAVARELGAPYRDVKKAVTLKTKYIIAMLKDKGKE